MPEIDIAVVNIIDTVSIDEYTAHLQNTGVFECI